MAPDDGDTCWRQDGGGQRVRQLTSGLPFGRRNSSGTIFFMWVFLSSLGGVGFALYSVREKLVKEGVLARSPSSCEGLRLGGVCGWAVPFMPLAAAASSAPLARQGLVLSEEAMFPGDTLVSEWAVRLACRASRVSQVIKSRGGAPFSANRGLELGQKNWWGMTHLALRLCMAPSRLLHP